jgi:hypothetical protein
MLPVVISFANIGYRTFSENLLRNAREVLKHHLFVFYCLDEPLYEALLPYASDRIRIVLYAKEPVATEFVHYGNSPAFLKMMKLKMDIIQEALACYGFIHFVDGDVVFCKEPTEEYYEPYKDYDIIYQLDAPPPNLPYNKWTCTGNFVLRHTEATHYFLERIKLYQRENPNNEQECQRQLFIDAGIEDIRLFPLAKLTEFPHEDFTCGAFVRDNLLDFSKIMVFHANHVVGNEAKQGLLRKIGKWYMD